MKNKKRPDTLVSMNTTEVQTDAFDDISTQQRDRLIEVLDNLETHVQRQNSLKFTFLKGAVYGVGTVIGASVLVALFGGIVAATINEFIDGPTLTESLELNQ